MVHWSPTSYVSSPYVMLRRRSTDNHFKVNAGKSIVFAPVGLFCILSPVFVNLVGVKKTLFKGTPGWTVYSAALYQNNRYGTE